MKMIRHCICCNTIVETERDCDDNPLVIGPVYDGLIFRASGNFGSTIFDPMPIGVQEFLEIVICDDCIGDRADRVAWIHSVDTVTTAKTTPFSEREE